LGRRSEIYTRACPLLVPLAEEGWIDNEVAERTVAHYLESLKQSGIDTLLLGCTHYPLLRAMFARVLGASVRIVDSATATAVEVGDRLRMLRLAKRGADGSQSFFVTETPDRFVRVGRRFHGPTLTKLIGSSPRSRRLATTNYAPKSRSGRRISALSTIASSATMRCRKSCRRSLRSCARAPSGPSASATSMCN